MADDKINEEELRKSIKESLYRCIIRITSIEVIKDVNPLKKGLKIDFNRSVCFLVGDNGVGKSTIMDCLADKYKYKDDTYLKRPGIKRNIKVETIDQDFKVGYMDFHASDKRFAGAFGEDIGLQMGHMRASSGQVSISLLNKVITKLKEYKSGVIILDEPCRGMSIRNQLLVASIIRKFVEQAMCQIIVTSHSALILTEFAGLAQYFDVGKGCEVTFDEYYMDQSRVPG